MFYNLIPSFQNLVRYSHQNKAQTEIEANERVTYNVHRLGSIRIITSIHRNDANRQSINTEDKIDLMLKKPLFSNRGFFRALL